MAAGLPEGVISAEIRMLVSSTTCISHARSSFIHPLFDRAVGANLAYCLTHDPLQFFRVGIGVTLFNALHRAMKNPPTYRLLNKFRKVALFRALRSQKGADRMSRIEHAGAKNCQEMGPCTARPPAIEDASMVYCVKPTAPWREQETHGRK